MPGATALGRRTPRVDPAVTLAAATYATRALPAYVPTTASGRFDPARSVYNWKASNTRKLRAALAKARAGVGLSVFAVAGDSLTAGKGAQAGQTDVVIQVRDRLAAIGYPLSGTGWVFTGHNTATTTMLDSRYVYGGTGWAYTGFSFAYTATAGDTLTFTSDKPGTIVDVLAFDNTRAFQIQVDNDAATTWAFNAGTGIPKVVTVRTGLANTTHTVKITAVAGGNNAIAAIRVRGATGVELAGMGLSGYQTFDWRANNLTHGPMSQLATIAPQAVFIALGMNDAYFHNSATATVYGANLQTMASTFKAAGADVVLCPPHLPATDGAPGGYTTVDTAAFQQYLAAAYAAADAQDVPLLDYADIFGAFTISNGNGLVFDALHLNPSGYGEQARALVAAITT
jgi:lysophospholipase L1-like esterase